MNRIAQALLFALLLSSGFSSPLLAQAQGEFRGFSVAELDQMLAPVALYPDTVLSHVLIAATYPIEVVQAARWTRQNPGLSGERAVNSVIGQDWDPSVMALVAFPDLLARMDADLDWTQMLGDAFLIQEGEVLDSIQRLRAQAYHSGHLRSNEHVRVIREREVIYIEPPRRQVVFVPVYDTRVVYGSWAWAHYPPVFWYSPPRHRRSVAVYWGPAFHVPSAFFFSSFHWSQRQVVVVHHHHHYYRPHHPRVRSVVHHHHYRGQDLARHDAAQRWQHDPAHRRGVAYHPAVDERHRLMERRSAPQTASQASAQAPVRVADTRNSQREWAASRRSESLLSDGGSAPLRPTRSAASEARVADAGRAGVLSRAAGPDRAQRTQATLSTQRPAAGTTPRSAERATLGSNDPRASTNRSARSVEREIQSRSALQREVPTAARPAGSAPAPNAPRAGRQTERPAQSSASALSSAPRAGESFPATRPITRNTETRSPMSAAQRAAPARPASTPQAPAIRSPVTDQRGSVSAPQRAVAPPPRQATESRPERAPRTTSQRPSGSVQAPARTEPRAAERRSTPRVD